jgi:hypothetical protein
MFQWLTGGPSPEFLKTCGGKPRSPYWPQCRRAHLLLHPECAACGRKVSLEVHHIEPFHERPDLELDPRNLLTLCDDDKRTCHRSFGHLWDWTLSNPDVREIVAAFRRQVDEAKRRLRLTGLTEDFDE